VAESRTDRFVRSQGWLEPVADAIQKAVGGFYSVLGRPGRLLKDVLHGQKPLGHPLHPALTDVPLGAWTAGVVADLAAYATHAVPTAAGDVALAVGVVGALGAALTGYTDHHETYGHERRMATMHGLVMTVVLVLELVSLGLRWWAGGGWHTTAVALALVALLVALGGAYLGGHLTFGIGTMVNRNAFAEGPQEYVPVGTPADFPEGRLCRVQAGSMPALVVRRDGVLHAIASTCSHAGGPLDEGELDGDVVVCPWHGSRFCVRDGGVRGGPATFPQPAFAARERDGMVELKLAQPPH
jgi:nitrite reductase/ring-hydroxylating ferredoxin subunit/uncharacterized membrane protein